MALRGVRAIIVTCSECVLLAFGTRHVMRMRHTVIACPALHYFSTLPHKRHDFREEATGHEVCFNFLYNFCLRHLILRIIQRDIMTNIHRSSCKVPVIIVRFLKKLEFSRQAFEKSSNIKFHENPSSGSGVFPCGRTDRHDEANRRFSQFCARAQ